MSGVKTVFDAIMHSDITTLLRLRARKKRRKNLQSTLYSNATNTFHSCMLHRTIRGNPTSTMAFCSFNLIEKFAKEIKLNLVEKVGWHDLVSQCKKPTGGLFRLRKPTQQFMLVETDTENSKPNRTWYIGFIKHFAKFINQNKFNII